MKRLPLILASGSPRRRELLDCMGLSYTVDSAEVDERCDGTPEEIVREVSMRKAKAIADKHPNALVLSADTIVFFHHPYGKPLTKDRAKTMLSELCGHWHDVYTGMTLINTGSCCVLQAVERTKVHLIHMTLQEIEEYVASNEPLDKAGAYAIQGRGGMYVDRIEGSHSNVIGLPMSVLHDLLKRMDRDVG